MDKIIERLKALRKPKWEYAVFDQNGLSYLADSYEAAEETIAFEKSFHKSRRRPFVRVIKRRKRGSKGPWLRKVD